MPSTRPLTSARSRTAPPAGHPAIRAWGALALSVVAVALVVTTFGILSLPLAAAAMALAASVRHRERPDAGSIAAIAWWISLIAVAITAVALIVLALDLAGVGSPNEGVQEAR